jgi:D-alanyl-D-alanine carboxypeptidase/D-alanyl-D-alanine-endopeptidase (penicillin-binding protein 4)
MSYYYAAQVSGLNMNETVVVVSVDPGKKPGDPLRVMVTPTDKYTKVVIKGRTVEKGQPSGLIVSRDLGMNQITVDGVLAVDAKPEDHKPSPITVEDPTHYATSYLLDKLKAADIDVTGGDGVGVTPDTGTTEVARHTSPPMSEILKRLNKPSDNLGAECLLKTLGAEKGKTGVGSTAAGREAAMTWFKSLGIDPEAVHMEDGSGLSRENFVSPRAYSIMLKTMVSHPQSKVFIDSLPIAGVDGTLRNRMKGTPAQNNCKAKSGYVSNVSSLSGYVTTRAGEPLLFVMFMNNHPARNAVPMGVQNKIVELLASWDKK